MSFTWLFAVTLINSYKEKEQALKGKLHNVQFEEKKPTRK